MWHSTDGVTCGSLLCRRELIQKLEVLDQAATDIVGLRARVLESRSIIESQEEQIRKLAEERDTLRETIGAFEAKILEIQTVAASFVKSLGYHEAIHELASKFEERVLMLAQVRKKIEQAQRGVDGKQKEWEKLSEEVADLLKKLNKAQTFLS